MHRKGYWLNRKLIRDRNTEHPCMVLGYCPYGQLVEEFPIEEIRDKLSCRIFGHDCPVHYHKEDISEVDIEKVKKEG